MSYIKNCKNMQSETESLPNQHSKFSSCFNILIIIMLLRMHRWCQWTSDSLKKCTLQCTGKIQRLSTFKHWRGQLSVVVTSVRIKHGETGQRSADMMGSCGRRTHVKMFMLSEWACWEILTGESRITGGGRSSRPHLCWNDLKIHFARFC